MSKLGGWLCLSIVRRCLEFSLHLSILKVIVLLVVLLCYIVQVDEYPSLVCSDHTVGFSRKV